MADHDYDRGLAHDLKTLAARRVDRRKMLGWLVAATVTPVLGCGGGDAGPCAAIPEETAGPYPGDGTNGPDALAMSDIVRSDITASLGSGGATAAGVPLTIELTLVNTSGSCAALAGYAIYLWHCDREGQYSMYGAISGESYLRGVQETDADGKVTFTSIFPGCYDGRWPHMHFEIFASLADATGGGGGAVTTSQLALPEEGCAEVYAAAEYSVSKANLANASLDDDGVFSDGADAQLATITGSMSEGYKATLTIAIEV